MKIKQYSKVTYSSCILDEILFRESLDTHVLNSVNPRVKQIFRHSST